MTTALAERTSEMLPVSSVRTDGGTQPRAALYQNVIDDYAEALSNGASFPAIIVYFDGKDYWLADGFHRHGSHVKAGKEEILADIRQGTRRDAVLYSVGANASHGLRRTNEDKRRAVLTLLQDEEWAKWSDREIARRAGVGNKFVGDVRQSLCLEHSEPRTYTTKHGTTATMSVANIGRPTTPQKPVVLASSEPARTRLPDPDVVAAADEDLADAVEEYKQAKIAVAAAETSPRIAPVSTIDRERWESVIGTSDDRQVVGSVRQVVEEIDKLPSPAEVARRWPNATAYTVNTADIRSAARWLMDFCDEWDATRAHESEEREAA